jgi:hypothetical protein
LASTSGAQDVVGHSSPVAQRHVYSLPAGAGLHAPVPLGSKAQQGLAAAHSKPDLQEGKGLPRTKRRIP